MDTVHRVLLAVPPDAGFRRDAIRGVLDWHGRHPGRWTLLTRTASDPVLAQPDGYFKTDALEPVHGVICHGRPAALASVRERPTVHVGHAVEGVVSVAADDHAVGRLAVRHLLDRGFERLAWFGPPPGTPDVGLVFDARAAGFTEGAAEAGVEVSIAPPGTWTPWHRHDDASLEALHTWLRSLRLPVGLFCVNLDLARRTVDLLLPIGLRIPADVALLGVDRDELLCETSNPTLSTIDHGMRRCGYLAAEQLDRMMTGQAVSDEPTLVPPVRVESRQSTDVIAVEDDEVRQALEIIRARAADGFTARDVSASVPLSRRMLELRFKKAVGCTLQAAIGQRRIETACGLLRELPNAKLGEIARRSGFTTATRLHEAFRRQLGTTPQRYREQQDLAGRSWPEPDRDATGGQAVP